MSILLQTIKTTMPLNVLIIGAGCAGPAFAHLLLKTNPKSTVTVIERFPSLRTGGQQLDLKGKGIPIAKAMGILDHLKAACVHETGMQLVDKNGRSLIGFGVNSSSSSGQGMNLTNEYEIMRGDMVKVFHDGSIAERRKIEESGEQEGGLIYKFDTTVTHIEQSEKTATVTFSDGQKARYDLVVAADGQNSRTRRMAFGDDAKSGCFKKMGIHAAYFDIPRLDSDDNDARIFFAPGSRMVMTRTGDRPIKQIYFFLMREDERHERMKAVHKQPLAQQKEVWAEIFHDAGWDCQRYVAGMKSTDDFYAHEVGQIHMPQLYTGRVVLLGDAGYCPSPFTGMGTTLSLIGSYILAGELAKHGGNVDAALQAYHELMQEPLKAYQELPAGGQSSFYPASEMGIRIANTALWVLSSLKSDKVLVWFGGFAREKRYLYDMPTYPGLGLEDGEKK
jgi:2-polyprenyl-6-methoxyphenol hydroxylase-like FAD-dependent oxidoreductase